MTEIDASKMIRKRKTNEFKEVQFGTKMEK